MPHIEACLRELKELYGTIGPDTVKSAVEIERFAWEFAENSLWKRARVYQSNVLSIRSKRLGRFHEQTVQAQRSLAESNFNLAGTYLHLRKQDASRALLVEVLRKRKRLFGTDHPDTLMTRNELGMSFCLVREKLAAAERLVSNVLAARKRILGEEHAYTLWSMNDLAKVFTTRQRPHEAIAILDKAGPVIRRTLGERHSGMSMTKANLAQAYVRTQ